MTRSEFAQHYFEAAKKAVGNSGLFPETLLVQAILESRTGQSLLSKKANNFFGIKSGSSWTGDSVIFKTKEFLKGKWVTVDAKFRAYNTPQKSFEDWTSFLQKNKRYSKVFEAKTPKEQLKAIANAGYATDPKYFELTSGILDKLKDSFPIATEVVKNHAGKILLFLGAAILLSAKK